MKNAKKPILRISIILLSILFLFYIQNRFVELNPEFQCVKQSKLGKIELEKSDNEIIEVDISRNLHHIKLAIYQNDTGFFYKCRCFEKIIDYKSAEFKDTIIFDTDKLFVTDNNVESIIKDLKKEIDDYPIWKKRERQYYGSCIKIKRFNSKTKILKTINCHSSSFSTHFNDKLGNKINSVLQVIKVNGFIDYYKLFLSGPQGV
jgi:hypothetical protein